MKSLPLAALCAIILLPSSSMARDIGTSFDDNGHIAFTYGNSTSIKIAPKVSALENSSCAAPHGSPSLEGALRYNTHPSVKTLEFCDGTIWKRFMPKQHSEGEPIYIDYKSCTPAKNLGSNPYGTGKLSGISLMCPRNYVIVASDDVKNTDLNGDWGTYNAAYCCKLTLDNNMPTSTLQFQGQAPSN